MADSVWHTHNLKILIISVFQHHCDEHYPCVTNVGATLQSGRDVYRLRDNEYRSLRVLKDFKVELTVFCHLKNLILLKILIRPQ